jgi:hypothetical protein
MTELDISGQTALNDEDVRGLIDKSSGSQMSMSEWYGAQSAFPFNYSGNATTPQSVSTLATAAGWDGTVPVIMTLTSSATIHSNVNATAALTLDVAGSTIINNGKIAGHGSSATSAGGDALAISVSGTTIQNNSGAFIAGAGGGGAGSQGGGGAGQATLGSNGSGNGSGTGASCYGGLYRTNGSASGCCAFWSYSGAGVGGPQGGQSVSGQACGGGSCSSCGSFYGGGCAGVSVSSCTNKAPAGGGSVLSASSNVDGSGTNGGGGWGRVGKGGGGAAGEAIATSQSYTYVNNGTVYGSV